MVGVGHHDEPVIGGDVDSSSVAEEDPRVWIDESSLSASDGFELVGFEGACDAGRIVAIDDGDEHGRALLEVFEVGDLGGIGREEVVGGALGSGAGTHGTPDDRDEDDRHERCEGESDLSW